MIPTCKLYLETDAGAIIGPITVGVGLLEDWTIANVDEVLWTNDTGENVTVVGAFIDCPIGTQPIDYPSAVTLLRGDQAVFLVGGIAVRSRLVSPKEFEQA